MNKYSPYILFLLITILTAVLYVNDFGPLNSAQRSINDLIMSVTAEDKQPANVAIVRIDPKAMDQYGEWPWDHDLIADLTAAVASGEPKAILLDFDIPEDAEQAESGHTEVLTEQLQWIRQVVLEYDIALATYQSGRTATPQYLFNNSIAVDNPLGVMDEDASLLTRKVFLPAEQLLTHKPFMGFRYHTPDADRVLRRQPLIMFYDGYYYPDASLTTAGVYLGIAPPEIKVIEGESVWIGTKRKIPIDDRGELLLTFPKGNPFREFTATEILGEGFNFEQLKDKAIIIGLASIEQAEQYHTSISEDKSGLLVKATVIENIINSNFVKAGDELGWLYLLLMFVLGGAGAFFLPRLNLKFRLLAILGALIILVNAAYLIYTSDHILFEVSYLTAQLLLFMIASPMLDSELLLGAEKAAGKRERATSRPKATPVKAGEQKDVPMRFVQESETAQQPTVQVDAVQPGKTSAFAGESDSDGLDHQAIDIDSDGVFLGDSDGAPTGGTAQQEQMADSSGDLGLGDAPFDDIAEDESGGILRDAADPEIKTTSDSQQIRELTKDDIRNLGRYQVTGVLGKGAMGTVYKGIDPAINRPVALKTIRLDFVNDPEELEELKERLHREAQAAGKLSHPNIVTIYDVGSEGSLQYIAMEYLEGRTLEDMIKKKVRFNYRIIAQIITQICNALGYAHDRGIVHRDIKPANIMILSDYRVKVMDYGIARVDSNSMTKTGIAMGTPNYISPEQLRGLTIDRRADLFSLGVVMYEMLLGRRPFKGENITALIYSILNNEPEKPTNVKPQIPLLFDHIIGRALQKDPNQRYQKATELINDLADFVESFVTKS